MKKLLFTIIISIFIINNANALKIDEKYQTMCNNIWWELVTHTTYANCSINKSEISLDSLKDKYLTYVSWIMIKYSSEYKYSNKEKWNNYLEFFAQDIEDLKIFREWKLDSDAKEKIEENIDISSDLYDFLYLRKEIGEKNAKKIELAFEKKESLIAEKDLQNFYEKLQERTASKISSMEYSLMITRFTQDWYRKFMLQLNALKYLEKLIDWRIN